MDEIMKQVALAFVYKNKGDWLKTYDCYKNGIKPTDEEFQVAADWLESKNLDFIFILDKDYPEEYKGKFYKPPFVIFIDKDGNRILDTEMDYKTGKKKKQPAKAK